MNISLLKFKEAEEAYELAAEADTANFEIVFEFAIFLQKQNQFSKVLLYLEHALLLTPTNEARANTLNCVGLFYEANQKMSEAEKAYSEAMNIFQQLVEDNPNAFFLLNMAGTLNNLGRYYYTNQKMPEAEKAYSEALRIFRQLTGKNPDAFMSYVATTLNNLGVFYSVNRRMSEAEKALTEALNIRRKLDDKNPNVFLSDVAATLCNLGNHYSVNQKMPEAEKSFTEALNIQRQAASENPDAFLPELAITLNNMGIFCSTNQKIPEAEKAYNEALNICRQLATKSPDAFLPKVAKVLGNLGNFYNANQKKPEAEKAYNEALSIFRELAAKNPDAFLPDVAMTLNDMGSYYYKNQKMLEAEKSGYEALSIRRKLAAKNPEAFLPDLAVTLNGLGTLNRILKKYSKALGYFEESLKLGRSALLQGKTHSSNESDLVHILTNISIIKDSCQNRKDYTNATWAGHLLSTTYDSLQHLDLQIRRRAVREYGSLSWWSLLARDYPLAEHAALSCLTLDPEQIWVYTNLAHAHLLRGDLKKAKEAYLHLKGKKDGNGKDYKVVIEEDFQALEAEGITHEGMAEIRVWLREEW